MTIKKTLKPQVILTGFADECSNEKTLVEQFATFAALGLQYYSVRFVNLGDGVKNVMALTTDEIRRVIEVQNDYGLNVSSIGSPIGKIKLLDVEDGSNDRYVPFDEYLEKDVKRVCDVAHLFDEVSPMEFSGKAAGKNCFGGISGNSHRQIIHLRRGAGKHLAVLHEQGFDTAAGISSRKDAPAEIQRDLSGKNIIYRAELHRKLCRSGRCRTLCQINQFIQHQLYFVFFTFEEKYHPERAGYGSQRRNDEDKQQFLHFSPRNGSVMRCLVV
jgi:hypothetical protein